MKPLIYSLLLVGVLLTSCQSPEKASVQPLPGGQQMSYRELVQRGRLQVDYAHDSFYRDNWDEVLKAADAMKDTAKRLTDLDVATVPAVKQAKFASLTKELSESATLLEQSGKAKDADKTAAAFTKLHLVIRQLFVE
jgi:hypothetical protein